MSKRKTNKPRTPDAEATGVPKPASQPKRAVSAALTGSEGEELQATPVTETRLPEVPGEEIASALPPVPPPELELKPVPSPHIEEPKLDVAIPVGVRADAGQSVHAAPAEAKTVSSSPNMGRPLVGPLRAIAGMEACQQLLMEMTRDNLDLAASLASMRSPLDMIDVATKFAGRQVGMYGRFSKAVADIATGRQQA